MSAYESAYRRYYNELKKGSSIKGEIKDTSISDYLPRYSSAGYGSRRVEKTKKNSGINVFIFELVGVLILFLFVVVSRNSSNLEVKEYYNLFESSIKQEHFETESIIEGINRYLDFNESSGIQEKNL